MERVKNSVTSVTESRDDVGIFVETFVDDAAVNFDLRKLFLHLLDALRSRDDRQHLDARHAPVDQRLARH